MSSGGPNIRLHGFHCFWPWFNFLSAARECTAGGRGRLRQRGGAGGRGGRGVNREWTAGGREGGENSKKNISIPPAVTRLRRSKVTKHTVFSVSLKCRRREAKEEKKSPWWPAVEHIPSRPFWCDCHVVCITWAKKAGLSDWQTVTDRKKETLLLCPNSGSASFGVRI